MSRSAACDVGDACSECDVLRRCIGREQETRLAARVVHGHPSLVARRYPDVRTVRQEADVVGEERRRHRSDEPWARGIGHIDDREARCYVAEPTHSVRAAASSVRWRAQPPR